MELTDATGKFHVFQTLAEEFSKKGCNINIQLLMRE